MKAEEAKGILKALGWKENRWGAFERGEYRMKVTKNSIRLEGKTESKQWVRLRSAYLRDVSIDESGQLKGLNYYGCQPKIQK